MNKYYQTIAGMAIGVYIGLIIASFRVDSQIKSIAIKQSLDIAESRQREALLYKECKLLQYQVDILSEKMK